MISYSYSYNSFFFFFKCVFSSKVYSDIAQDCCLSTHNGRIPRRLVESYYLQTVDSGCHIRATVFTTWKGRRLCAPPPENSHWVAKLIFHPLGNGPRRTHDLRRSLAKCSGGGVEMSREMDHY
uniref:Chemokine interleukin-8-like domain-containing protein n=1 Tax=Denticeps clupeoides TaxID=299321 RepID=A0AAY4BHE5_9TELE